MKFAIASVVIFLLYPLADAQVPPGKPTITGTGVTGSYALTVNAGDSFTVTCKDCHPSCPTMGASAVSTWKWRKTGTAGEVATTAAFTKTAVVVGDAGSYTCLGLDGGGNEGDVSDPLVVTVNVQPDKPTIVGTGVTGSYALTVTVGDSFTVTCTEASTGESPDGWLWKKGGSTEVATSAAFTKTAAAEDAGDYTCFAKKGSASSVASETLTITVNAKGSSSGSSSSGVQGMPGPSHVVFCFVMMFAYL